MRKLILLLTLTVMFVTGSFAQSYVQIGTGTTSNNQPFYGSWNNTWTKTLYLQSEIGAAKTITQIAYDMISAAPLSLAGQKIYMKHTSVSSLAVSYEDPLTSGYTLVYDGTVNLNITGWNQIDITDFSYNGTDNLIVLVEDRNNASHYKNFNCTDYSGTVRIVEAGCDNSGCWPTSGATEPFPKAFGNIRLYYSSTGPATPSNPQPADNADKVSIDTIIQFDLGANTTSYDLYAGTDSADVLNLNISERIVNNATVGAPGTYSFTPPSLMGSKTKYFWRVIAKNGAQTENSPLWKFRTQAVITSFPYNQGFEDSTVFYPGWYGQRTDWSYTSTGNNAIWNAASGLNPHTGGFCAYVSPYSGSTESSLITPRIILPSGIYADFFWRNGSTAKVINSDTTFFEITTNGGTTWTTLDTLSPLTAQTQYDQVHRDLSAFAGNNVYLRWRYKMVNYSGSKYTYLDDIKLFSPGNNSEILIQPGTINFNEVYIGGYTTEKVIISNIGTQNLVITGVSASSPFSSTYSGTIAPGQTDTATIIFTPLTASTYVDQVSFAISGSYTGNNILNVTATGLNPVNSFFESFDLSTNLPAHWNKLRSDTDINNDVTVIASSFDSYSAPNCAKILNMNDSISPLMMITPGVTNFNINKLRFYVKTAGAYDLDLIIGVMYDPYDASSFIADTMLTVSGTYANYTVTLDPANTAPYIAFRHGQNRKISSFRIDDVSWESSAPLPPNPASVIYPADSAVDVDIMMGLTLKWANGGGSPDGYRVYFSETNPPDTKIKDTISTDCPINGILNYSTTYYWKVIPYNIHGTDSLNCPVWKFTTMSDPTKNLPWSENFDALTQKTGYTYPLGWSYQNLPSAPGQTYFGDCWDLIVNNSGNPNNAHSAPNAMSSGPEFYEKNNWLFTPPLHINPSAGQCRVLFWYKAVPSGVSYDVESLRLTLGSNHNISANIDTLWNQDTIVNTNYIMGTADFTVSSEANYFIGFQAHSPSNYPDVQNFALLIDDISVTYLSSIDENSISFGTYPNPAHDFLIISLVDNPESKARIELVNILGQISLCIEMSSKTELVNLTGVKAGMYFIRVSSGNKTSVKKIVIQ